MYRLYPQIVRVAVCHLDLQALISEVIQGLEDLCFTWLKVLREMLVRRLGISLSDREHEIWHYVGVIVTEIAAGEPRSTAANEVHGDSFAGSCTMQWEIRDCNYPPHSSLMRTGTLGVAGSCSGRGMMRSAS